MDGIRVIDNYGTDKERLKARAKDRETSWRELVGDEDWNPDTAWGGFCFLDEIGLIYYLPAAMLRSLALGYDAGIEFILSNPVSHLYYPLRSSQDPSRFDLRQARCVKRFLHLMVNIEVSTQYGMARDGWKHALDSFWKYIPDDDSA